MPIRNLQLVLIGIAVALNVRFMVTGEVRFAIASGFGLLLSISFGILAPPPPSDKP